MTCFDISIRYIVRSSGAGSAARISLCPLFLLTPWRPHVLELAVLGLLAEQPLHGYELKKRLSETLGPLWGISFGSLYPALRRLERGGAIEAVEPADSAPTIVATGSVKGDLAAARVRRRPRTGLRTRKAYRITPA